MDDKQTDVEHHDYLMIGTVESYRKLKEYYGEAYLVPIYIEVDDGVRLQRALERREVRQSRNMRRCAADFWRMRQIFHRKSCRRQASQRHLLTTI